MGLVSSSGRCMIPCWCQGFQKYFESSRICLFSLFDQPLDDATWLMCTLVPGCLGVRALEEMMALGRVRGTWILAGIHHFCLWFSIRHCYLPSECTQVKHTVNTLWNEISKLLGEQIAVGESCEETERLFKEASMKTYDLCA